MPGIAFDQVVKRFGEVTAVRDLTLDVADGEFVVLVGPSGCGKTTALRMLAGLEAVSSGRILIGDREVQQLPPRQRDVAMVFQDYALYPQMSVYRNLAFGLQTRKVPREQVRRLVTEAAERLGLGELLDRKPRQLSGGQRQRVALARAIVNHPQVLLLDEPLGALDLKLRQDMQIELQRIQQEVGITFVYVTHDQEEALTMSDRLAVFNAGRIEQVGSPADVYEHPQTEFVAGFVGVSNVLERMLNGRTSRFTVRPEKIRILAEHETPEDGAHTEAGEISEVVYVGMVTRYAVALDEGGTLMVIKQNLETTSSEALEARGKRVSLAWRPEHTYAIEQGEEEEIKE